MVLGFAIKSLCFNARMSSRVLDMQPLLESEMAVEEPPSLKQVKLCLWAFGEKKSYKVII